MYTILKKHLPKDAEVMTYDTFQDVEISELPDDAEIKFKDGKYYLYNY